MVWLILSLLAGVTFAKACGEVSVTVITDTVTITAAFTGSYASDLLWRHKVISTTMNSPIANVSSAQTQIETDSALATQSSVSTDGSPSTAAIASTATGSSGSYSQPILDQHNKHRTNCSALPLTWSNDLANTAAQIASSCVYAHDTYIMSQSIISTVA